MFGFMKFFRRGPVEVTLSPESIEALRGALRSRDETARIVLPTYGEERRASRSTESVFDALEHPPAGLLQGAERLTQDASQEHLSDYSLYVEDGEPGVQCRQCALSWLVPKYPTITQLLETIAEHHHQHTAPGTSEASLERATASPEDRPDPAGRASAGSDTRPEAHGVYEGESFSEEDLMRRAANEQMRRRPETSSVGSSGEDSTPGGMREELRSISEDQGYRSATDRVLGEGDVDEYSTQAPETALWIREGKVWHLAEEKSPRLTICGLAVLVIRARRDLPLSETPASPAGHTTYAVCPNCERIAQGGSELRAAIESGFVVLPTPTIDDWYRAQEQARDRVRVMGDPESDATASDVRPESPETRLAAEAYVDTEGDFDLPDTTASDVRPNTEIWRLTRGTWHLADGEVMGPACGAGVQLYENEVRGRRPISVAATRCMGCEQIADARLEDLPDTCPKCGHAYHLKPCLNLASDNECASGCMTSLVGPHVVSQDGSLEVIQGHWVRVQGLGSPWHHALTGSTTACEIAIDPARWEATPSKPDRGPWCLACTQEVLHEEVVLEHTVLDTEEEPEQHSWTMGAEILTHEPPSPPDDVQREAERVIKERLRGGDE